MGSEAIQPYGMQAELVGGLVFDLRGARDDSVFSDNSKFLGKHTGRLT